MACIQAHSTASSTPESAHMSKKWTVASEDEAATSLSSTMTLGASFASTRRVPSRGHPVAISDRQLYHLAQNTANAIQWDAIISGTEGTVSRWRWLENRGNFAIYTRQHASTYAVLAVGALRCTASELMRVLHNSDPEQHLEKTSAIYADDVRSGAVVYNVELDSDRLGNEISSSASSVLADLAVKTATFNKVSWLHSHEEWCYLESLHRHNATGGFETHIATLCPKDLVVGKSTSRTKFFHGVTSGFCVKPEESELSVVDIEAQQQHGDVSETESGKKPVPVHSTRVYFYAEFAPPSSSPLASVPSMRSHASDKTIKQRLLKMAQSCERLTQLVRRRRLGVQVLVDQKRVLPPTNTRCWCCDKSLLVAKLCRVCGQGVCGECSGKNERESYVRGGQRMRVESIRVCVRCMDRVDRSNYANVTDASLVGPNTRPSPVHAGAKPEDLTLRDLLERELVQAPSEQRKQSVMNVIRCVVDQASPRSRTASLRDTASFSKSRGPAHSLTSSSSVTEYVTALDSLDVARIPYTDMEFADSTGRGYLYDPRDPDEQMAYPVPANEAQRLQAIRDSHVLDLGKSEELNIICDLAAKELDSFASLVTVISEDEQQVVAANMPMLENAKFPRAQAFCSHLIMDNKPLLVPHPEADIRFQLNDPVQNMGARFYCGFPLVAEDNETVIGSLCCVDNKTRDLTEAQYAALNQLAKTAAKVVRLQVSQRHSLNARPSLVRL